jgi:hypothetical protein
MVLQIKQDSRSQNIKEPSLDEQSYLSILITRWRNSKSAYSKEGYTSQAERWQSTH